MVILLKNQQSIAETFNQFFVHEASRLTADIKSKYRFRDYLKNNKFSSASSFFIKPVVESDIVSIVSGLANKMTSGDDNIPITVIKRNINSLKAPLAYLFDMSLEQFFISFVDYHTTKALSGHGCCGSYLKKIGKTDLDICWFCDAVDGPQHIIFECTHWSTKRTTLEQEVRHSVHQGNFIRKVMSEEERFERGRGNTSEVADNAN
ncbi:hypothetical protein HHI36_013132 [Cryptolaemus montrouzieri]|uniref:Reverse transcriptase zinc-binding domain-containing protein n=1 Tax=Cryptolaemus montrouzieri TaxID=559131 RepID=A0ABD2NHA3_9CUCU